MYSTDPFEEKSFGVVIDTKVFILVKGTGPPGALCAGLPLITASNSSSETQFKGSPSLRNSLKNNSDYFIKTIIIN